MDSNELIIRFAVNGYSFPLLIPDKFKNLEPYQVQGIISKALSIGLKAIESNPNWLDSCKREYAKKRILAIQRIRQEYANHRYLKAEEFFRYYMHYHPELRQFKIKYKDVFS